MSMRAFGYGVMGDPAPGVPFREDPSLSAGVKWVNPQKHHFFTLPTRAEQDAVRNANDAMNKAIQQLLHAGVMPRWILQTANRFAAQAMQLPEPPIWTVWDDQPSAVSPSGPGLAQWVWDGERYVLGY